MAGAGEWIKTHKTAAAVGGLGGVAGLALYMRSRRGSSSSSSTGLGTSASPAPAVGGAFDSSAMDTYNQLASAISSQNDQISKIQSELPSNAVAAIPPATGSGILTPPPVAGLPAQHMMGAGYLPVSPADASQPFAGHLWLSSPSAAAADAAQGIQLDYQPTPGFFQPITGNNFGALPANTPVYAPAPGA